MTIKTLKDSVDSFKKYSKCNIIYIDDDDTTLLKYITTDDIILIHYSLIHSLAIIYNDLNLYNISTSEKINTNDINNININFNLKYIYFTHFLINFTGSKICMIQDEYYYTNYFKNYFELVGMNIVFSCIPSLYVRKIYNNLDNTIFINYITGYTFETENRKPIKDRLVDVFYRGRVLHFHYGDLGQDKKNIGIHMQKYCEENNLKNDIKWYANECIYGDKWLEHLSNAKVTLATESGSNIFDVDGTLKKQINKLLEIDTDAYLEFPENTKYTYEEIKKMVDMTQNYIPQGQVSPKMFEAISVGTVLVMYEGSYMNIFKPGIHYIELKKDYSNIKEVIERIRDDDYLQNMADRAYNDIIKSNLYSYKKFIDMFDEIVTSNKNIPNNILSIFNNNIKTIINTFVNNKTTNLLILRTEKYQSDPRRDYWYESGLEYNIKLHQLCNYQETIYTKKYNKTLFNSDIINNCFTDNILQVNDNYSENIYKFFKEILNNSSHKYLLNAISILTDYYKNNKNSNTNKKTHNYLNYIKHILNNNYRIMKYINKKTLNNIKLIIVPNLTNLLSGIIINLLYNIPFIYDSLEYYPQNIYGDVKEVLYEDIWHKFESELLKYVKYKYTVNPLIAEFMEKVYNTKYNNIPNCVPFHLSKYLTNKSNLLFNNKFNNENVRFLFQGGISYCRNFDKLINMWKYVNKNAILILRSPQWQNTNDFKKLASNLNLLNKNIFFLDSISVDELLNGIKNDCDVGIIPYSSSSYNNQFCSPNKFGEYMSMGKPILANHTDYVNKIINEFNCGICIDFNKEDLFIETVNKLTLDVNLRNKLANNSKKCFENYFNWEKQSIDFYRDIKQILNS